MKIEEKYTLKKPFVISYYLLLFIGFLLTIGRWLSVPILGFVVINAEIHSHISNFSLSLIFYLSIGTFWLLSDVKFRYITILGGVLLAGNLLCETLMGFMNTPDIIDALYGAVGTLIAFVYLIAAFKSGLVPAKSKETD